MVEDPRRYYDSAYLEAASAIEKDYPDIAKGLRIMVGETARSAPDESELENATSKLLSVIREVDNSMLAADWAARIQQEFDEISSRHPELTEPEQVEACLEKLVTNRFIGKGYHEHEDDINQWYGPIWKILEGRHIQFSVKNNDWPFTEEYASGSITPGEWWTPELIKKAADETGMHPADLTMEIGNMDATVQLFLPPLEDEK